MKIILLAMLLVWDIGLSFSDEPPKPTDTKSDPPHHESPEQSTADSDPPHHESPEHTAAQSDPSHPLNYTVGVKLVSNDDEQGTPKDTDSDNEIKWKKTVANYKDKFQACCKQYFESESGKCADAFEKSLFRSYFKEQVIEIAEEPQTAKDMSNFVLDQTALHMSVEKVLSDTVQRRATEKFLVDLIEIFPNVYDTNKDYKEICVKHESFINKKQNFIDADSYGIIMAESILFYNKNFDTVIGKIIDLIDSKEHFNCFLDYSAVFWDKYQFFRNIDELIGYLKTTDLNKLCEQSSDRKANMVEVFLDSPKSYMMMKCWFDEILKLKAQYDPAKSIDDQSANFQSLLEKCSNVYEDTIISSGVDVAYEYISSKKYSQEASSDEKGKQQTSGDGTGAQQQTSGDGTDAQQQTSGDGMGAQQQTSGNETGGQ